MAHGAEKDKRGDRSVHNIYIYTLHVDVKKIKRHRRASGGDRGRPRREVSIMLAEKLGHTTQTTNTYVSGKKLRVMYTRSAV